MSLTPAPIPRTTAAMRSGDGFLHTPIRTVIEHSVFSDPITDHLISNGWEPWHGADLIAHLGREALQGCPGRDFSQAWIKDPDTGAKRPKLHKTGTRSLERCQYVILTHPQRSAVLVLDIDRVGSAGGTVEKIHPDVLTPLNMLAKKGLGPAWVGINPQSGKTQLLWLIDPVYTGKNQPKSPNVRLLSVVTEELNGLLGGDQAFSHRLSRWPLHISDDPTAYRWHHQHSIITRLSTLLKEVRTMSGKSTPARPSAPQFASGRARIEAARAAVEEAKLLNRLNAEMGTGPNSEEFGSVHVFWAAPGRAARDETGFRYALATGFRLRAAQKPVTVAALINAYEKAYNTAQTVGADGRAAEMPRMEGRLSMAARIQGYVSSGEVPELDAKERPRMSTAGKKALATMGRRGAAVANAKRWADKEGDLARKALEPLERANREKQAEARADHLTIAAWYARQLGKEDTLPTIADGASQFRVSESTVKRALSRAGISLPRGRRKKSSDRRQ